MDYGTRPPPPPPLQSIATSSPYGSNQASANNPHSASATPSSASYLSQRPPSGERLPSPAQPHSAPSQVNGMAQSPYPPFHGIAGPSSAPPGVVQDPFLAHDGTMSTPGISPSHVTAAALSAQKRAYRQRRKDPSCDACRERKVKCDATDTSSCSECSGRGVKCQFTKETNRRMSSIKQVQDLEKQLANAKQQILQLRSMVREGGTNDAEASRSHVPVLSLPEPPTKERRQAQPGMPNFDAVRLNLRNYGRGLFKPPAPYMQTGPEPMFTESAPLPPRNVADRLLSHYHGSVHVYAPMLHWPTFKHEYDELYRKGSFQGTRQIWVALFHAVLACGTLMEPQPLGGAQLGEGARYLEMTMKNVNTWTDDHTIDHARTTLLISIYFIENNMNSAGWVWLGACIRIAQDIGLQSDSGPFAPFEQEMRRRVWWSVYNWDRVVSMAIGRPLLIDDDDCDVGEPLPVDDEHLDSNDLPSNPPRQSQPNGLIAVIPVVRMTAQLRKTMKSRTIAAATIATYDEHFRTIMATYPDPFPIHSQTHLDPRLLTAACSMQTNRFFLYRHNLSPLCKKADRMDALARCVSVAKDTAHYVSRSMQSPSAAPASGYYSPQHMAGWAARLRTMAPAFFCGHLWRCILVLCLCGEYAAAQTLVQASAAVGDLRKTNICCGRNLAFFLEQLVERLRNGASQQALENDEEMLAYASGDMQGSADCSWAWAGGEGRTKSYGPPNGFSLDSAPTGMNQLSERELQEWGGWEHIQRVLNQLMQEQQQQNNQTPHTPLAPPPLPQQHQHPHPHHHQPPSNHHTPAPSYTTPAYPPPLTYPHSPGGARPPTLTPASAEPKSSVSPGPSMASGSNGSIGASNRISIKDIM